MHAPYTMKTAAPPMYTLRLSRRHTISHCARTHTVTYPSVHKLTRTPLHLKPSWRLKKTPKKPQRLNHSEDSATTTKTFPNQVDSQEQKVNIPQWLLGKTVYYSPTTSCNTKNSMSEGLISTSDLIMASKQHWFTW